MKKKQERGEEKGLTLLEKGGTINGGRETKKERRSGKEWKRR